MHGAKRVTIFFITTIVLPMVLIITPLYLRHSVFADVTYKVAESDVVAIVDGVSSVFCQKHSLRMNTSFNAFQLNKSPELSKKLKHIRLKKSMILPDDTFEYWGFYLLRGAEVYLKMCSRYGGGKLLVVRGEKVLNTCNLLEHQLKFGAKMDDEHDHVKVTYDTAAQEIHDSMFEEEDNAAEDITDTLQVTSHNDKVHKLQLELSGDKTTTVNRTKRSKRSLSGVVLDHGIEHGGNAINYTEQKSDQSSFEAGLLECYDGQILLNIDIKHGHVCKDVHYLQTKGRHMQSIHTVASDGYYYYIFYSDNDITKNDIHAVFDIYKPTFQYTNTTENKACVNNTECSFSLPFWTDEIVIVEVPTRDGIEQEDDDITHLISTCHPRMVIYAFFPIAVLFIIMGCAFL